MSRRSDRPHKHSRSKRPQQEDIPIDPSLTGVSYPEAQGYSQAGPSAYAEVTSASETQDTSQMAYYMMQQPATVNPNEVLINPGYDYLAQSYSSSAYQTLDYEVEPVASSSTAQVTNENYCSECDRSFDGLRDYNKHMKTHNKPVKCEADPKNCKVTKAEQRDMDRHYRTSHKVYAESKGIFTEEVLCGFEGCKKTFTRHDNHLRHWRNIHGYDATGQ
ncbi:hypothetical protein FHETE_232 [Fusarium heterosporum]|uniref:C2H2-type domain-containing protein n=1 Tax=Fusarium heterosporum TaxID=42747 RepID=A0A8H5TYS7_FUSHE|nr:hypothetical protein FHETE_232 [Fusarium heterosporum]